MSLESLINKFLKPFKYIDEQILTFYTKMVVNQEQKGENRYRLALKLNLLNLSYIVVSGATTKHSEIPQFIPNIDYAIDASLFTLLLHDVFYSLHGSKQERKHLELRYRANIRKQTSFEKTSQEVQKITRLGIVGYGLGLVGKLIYKSFRNDLSLYDLKYYASGIIVTTLLASSQYVKDPHQKLLKQQE